MLKEYYQGKIIGVWDPKHCSVFDPMAIYDASADGLSGTKEGFYFANWLMPFTIPFKLQGVAISPDDFPTCIAAPFSPCTSCRFFSLNQCPILIDKSNIMMTRYGFQFYRSYIYVPKGWDSDLFEVAQIEMLAHGRPLHYQQLFKILNNRYPTITMTVRKVQKILSLNPVFFYSLGDGVYAAIKGREKVDFFL